MDDPCKAVNPKELFKFQQGRQDLRYWKGTHASFWLAQCSGLKALRMTSPVQFVKLSQRTLTMLRTPPDKCTIIEITHKAPDGSEVENTLYIHATDSEQARIEKCSPHEGRCSPNIPDYILSSIAGQQNTEILFTQENARQFLTKC